MLRSEQCNSCPILVLPADTTAVLSIDEVTSVYKTFFTIDIYSVRRHTQNYIYINMLAAAIIQPAAQKIHIAQKDIQKSPGA